ncbi:MAG: hemolysin family protein [Propionibacteriaceae bacterium]|nr:hemolysin family protein [Propionibacteriaceae bacterium]
MTAGTIAINLAAVLFFVLMNAFFVIAEFSAVRIRKSQVNVMVDGFTKKHVSLVTENLNSYLAACQLGITIASLAIGWLGEPAVSAALNPLFTLIGLGEDAIRIISIAIGFTLITALHVIFGEQVPKMIAIASADRWIRFSASVLVFFYRLTYPIMWVFTAITNGILRLVRHSPADLGEYYSEEEMKILLGESWNQGLIEKEKYEYLENVFELEDTDAKSIMTPRKEMVCLFLEDSMDEHLRTLTEHSFSRYPVCREDKDNIVGFIHIKDLAAKQLVGTEVENIETILREILVVHESISVNKLINVFKSERTKIAVVVDEHGGTSGIVTLSDVFDEIVGEIEDEYLHGEDENMDWTELAEGRYLVDASVDIDELFEKFSLEPVEGSEADTIGGFALEQFGEFPEVGESVEFWPLRFTVTCTEEYRIKSLEIEELPPQAE